MPKAFTLIELLVAIAIFSLIVAVTTGLFISAIQVQRNSLASQKLLDEASYTLEYISRALRMARKDLTGDCLGLEHAKSNYAVIDGRLTFLNYDSNCQQFFQQWDAGNSVYRLKENKQGIGENYLTSPALDVKFFNIGPQDSWDQDDKEQPRLTLFLKIKGAGQKPEAQPELKIQTTISQRNLDVPE